MRQVELSIVVTIISKGRSWLAGPSEDNGREDMEGMEVCVEPRYDRGNWVTNILRDPSFCFHLAHTVSVLNKSCVVKHGTALN
uniref:Bm9548 n=1 Tax=Brugia malayi TaxID=6279 RepID=A0A1I9G1C9_BRUMA|nr:Bm9548 [Brugia malayi]